MSRGYGAVVGLTFLASLVGISLVACAADERKAEPGVSASIKEARLLADKIDKIIATRWREKGIVPAAPTDDDEFLRRAYLDILGRIPRVSEVLDYKDREIAFPRENWIEKELLESTDYVNHFATTFRHLIVPPDNSQVAQGVGGVIELWLRQKFKENAHYDQIARELLASPLGENSVTTTFLQANQSKPENVAASTSRLFAGVKLECAQCHDHPFARWSRKQFWEFAAFFSGANADEENPGQREITIPGTDRKVRARFLDGGEPQWKSGVSAREVLSDWLLRAENPYFAKAAVNRIWAHFFGTGLVEPIDDISEQNPASHPELLEELARQFAAHDFDIKFLIRAITFSKTYQLSSAVSHRTHRDDERTFARMSLKGLTGDQLYNSLLVAMDAAPPAMADARMDFASPRAEFLSRFTNQERRTEYQTSILQALTLMNGNLMASATDLQKCRTLAKFANEPLDTAQRVEALYLVVLGRKPRADETKLFVSYVNSGGARKDAKIALADVFWALLNSAEFSLNH